MLTQVWQQQISPSGLVTTLLETSEFSFVQMNRGSSFLAVRLVPEAPELGEGLKALVGPTRSIRPVVSAMAFKTKAVRNTDAPRAFTSTRPSAGDDGARLLAAGPHHLLRLEKRDLDAAFPERISIGRAANKDIVLRHTSISKFHAWFEVDEALGVYVADAGSTNHTLVNGKRILPREATPVRSGTAIKFGSVETVLLDSPSLWQAFHASRKW